jgi:hypothetical protein
MKRMAGACMLLAVLGGCTNFRQDPACVDGSCADMRPTKPPAPTNARWSQRDMVVASHHADEPTITRMGPVDPPPPSQAVASTAGSIPSRSMNTPASYSSISGTKTVMAADKADVTISRMPATTTADRTPASVVNASDPDTPMNSAKPHTPQTTTDLKPAAASVDLTKGPVLEVSESKPGKPRELKPGMDELAAPRPLTPAMQQPVNPAANGPVVRLVNKKRITLNYEVKDVGPSGISGVELWYTRDAKDWKRHDSAPETRPPYIIEVSEEGLYGFTLLAKNGIGLSKDPPHRGDLPQVWVEVDLTKPAVMLTEVKAGFNDKAATMTIGWKANDKNLGSQPINVAYAEKEEGPWQPIVTNVENTGRCVWPIRPGLPPRFFVRVEAKDLAGNVGVAQTPTAVTVDMSRPTVHILDVEAGSR